MPRSFAGALAFLLGFALVLWLSPLSSRGEPASAELAQLEQRIHAAVDALRSRRDLHALPRREALDRVARAHSRDMVARGYMAHDTPEGRSPVDRLTAAGIDGFRLAGENIGRSNAADPVDAIVAAWLASPGHRQNLFSPPWNATGVGATRAPDGSLVVTQVFATFPR